MKASSHQGTCEKKVSDPFCTKHPKGRFAAIGVGHFSSVHSRRHRRGTVTVVVLVIIVVISALMGQFVQRALQDRRSVGRDLQHLQAVQLADAGIGRVQRQQKSNPGFSGETWTLDPGQIHQTNSAEVVITIQDGSATVVARYPTNHEFPCQVTRQLKLEAE